MTNQTLICLFEEAVSRFKQKPQMWEHNGKRYEPLTYFQTKEEVYKVAAGFIDLGIQKGDRVTLISEGRNDWLISELGLLYVGAINVPLSTKLKGSADLSFRINHSGSRFIIVSAQQMSKIETIREDIKALDRIIYLDAPANPASDDMTLTAIKKRGEEALRRNSQVVANRIKEIVPDDIVNILYTSGTSADPKGVTLTHKNYYTNIHQSLSHVGLSPDELTLGILPWDHAFAHTTCLYCYMAAGAAVASIQRGETAAAAIKNIPKNIRELRPTMLMSVPALSKNFRKSIEESIREKGGFTWRLFQWGLATSKAYHGLGQNRGKGSRGLLLPLVKFFDMLIFSKIRAGFGGRLSSFIGGGAILDLEQQKFFAAIGMPIYQGYGLSEASPVISANSKKFHKFGSSGKPISSKMKLFIMDEKGNELPQGEHGEIVIEGDNVMKGYWENPKATEETLRGGKLYTGDIGYLDKDGYLYVLGRFKSLLIGEDGEKYAPEGIEEAIAQKSNFIDQIVLYNDQKPYTIGLVVPNITSIVQALEKQKIAYESKEGLEKGLSMIEKEIQCWRSGGTHAGTFPDKWLPSKITILPEAISESNGLINSTLKIVRHKVYKYFRGNIEYAYSSAAHTINNAHNRANLLYNHNSKQRDATKKAI